MRSECRTLFTCVMFLTRLPVGSWADHHPTFLMRSMAYFPFVGIFIGAWGGVWFQAAVGLWGATTAAAISTLATVWLTGAPSAARPPPPFHTPFSRYSLSLCGPARSWHASGGYSHASQPTPFDRN